VAAQPGANTVERRPIEARAEHAGLVQAAIDVPGLAAQKLGEARGRAGYSSFYGMDLLLSGHIQAFLSTAVEEAPDTQGHNGVAGIDRRLR
jgi:hypothetical protein